MICSLKKKKEEEEEDASIVSFLCGRDQTIDILIP